MRNQRLACERIPLPPPVAQVPVPGALRLSARLWDRPILSAIRLRKSSKGLDVRNYGF